MAIREGTAALLGELGPGMSVYLPGASGEILALAEALADEPDRARGCISPAASCRA